MRAVLAGCRSVHSFPDAYEGVLECFADGAVGEHWVTAESRYATLALPAADAAAAAAAARMHPAPSRVAFRRVSEPLAPLWRACRWAQSRLKAVLEQQEPWRSLVEPDADAEAPTTAAASADALVEDVSRLPYGSTHAPYPRLSLSFSPCVLRLWHLSVFLSVCLTDCLTVCLQKCSLSFFS